MEFKTLVKEPTTLTFVTTTKCSSACSNCCFQCSPKRNQRLSKEQMFGYMNQVKRDFPKVKVLVLTGGECTLLPDLTEIIKVGTEEYGLSVRIVTNAHWANSYEKACKKVKEWTEAGLKEINFSTGDEHLEYVSAETIKNAILASVEYGLVPFLNVESQESHKIDSNFFVKDEQLSKLVLENKLIIINGIWIDFKHPEEIARKPQIEHGPSFQKCDNLFTGITITPDNRLKACCGIVSNKIKYLDLGNPDKKDLRTLYDNQFFDFIKIWLHAEGPHRILEFASKYDDRIKIEDYTHIHQCLVCAIILKNQEILDILNAHYHDVYSNVVLKYNLT